STLRAPPPVPAHGGSSIFRDDVAASACLSFGQSKMKWPHRPHCRSAQSGIPTINQKKIRCRYLRFRPAAAIHYSRRKGSGSKSRSKLPNPSLAAESGPEFPAPEKSATTRPQWRSHRDWRKAETRRRVLSCSRAPDHLRVTSRAQIGLIRRWNQNAENGVIK